VSTITASIAIAATPKDVWNTVMDPQRLEDWVSIHRRLRHSDEGPARVGYRMDQQLSLRGVSIDVHWRLAECIPYQHATWEGQGPAHSRARTEYKLTAQADGGTRFDYCNEFHVPLGPVGAIVSRALVGGIPEREATRTLERLRDLLER
jgi:uncharacterized protein YndB with AHSA1/START domain